MGIIGRIFGGSSREGPEKVDDLEIIISELNDDPTKLFVWQFPQWDSREVENFYEEVEDRLVYTTQSEHILVAGEVEIEELIAEDGNVIRAREEIFKELTEDE